MATELIKGRTIDEALNFSNQEVVDALGGLPPVKIHCSVLAEEALKAKYGLQYRVLNFFSSVSGRKRRRAYLRELPMLSHRRSFDVGV